jgi:PAS domain S-box-containing protein
MRLVADAHFCHSCGVSLTAAVTGEYELYDVERFFNYALDMLCIAGVDGFFKRVNPAFGRVLGYSPKELLGKPFVDFIHPEDRNDTIAEVCNLTSGAVTLSFFNRYRCKDGSYKRLHWTSYPEQGTGLLYAVAREVP